MWQWSNNPPSSAVALAATEALATGAETLISLLTTPSQSGANTLVTAAVLFPTGAVTFA